MRWMRNDGGDDDDDDDDTKDDRTMAGGACTKAKAVEAVINKTLRFAARL